MFLAILDRDYDGNYASLSPCQPTITYMVWYSTALTVPVGRLGTYEVNRLGLLIVE